MKAVVAGVVVVVLTAAAVVLTPRQEAPLPPGAVPWKVEAHRSVRWALDCRVMSTKLTRDAYNPHDWVNRMERSGRGSETGHLVTDNGRCTLTKIKGRGPATLSLVKNGVTQAQSTDIGRKPAYAEVF